MEGQHNLLGPQRPSTHDQLTASFPITRNLIFSDARIKIGSCTVGPSIFSRPSKAAARHPNSGAEPVEWADENANARARRNIAIPAHFNWREWLRWLGSPGRIPRNTKRDSNARYRRSIGRHFCATCCTRLDNRVAQINHLDCVSVALAQARRGEFGRKRLDTPGREIFEGIG
jgi:hypothetical protein